MKPRSAKLLKRVIKLKTPEGVSSISIADEVKIDTSDLDTAFIHHAEQVAFWKGELAAVRRHRREVEQGLNVLKGSLFLQYRNRCEENNERFSDPYLNAEVSTHSDVCTIQEELNRLRSDEDDLDGVITALDHRRTCLMHIGARARDENELSIRTKHRG